MSLKKSARWLMIPSLALLSVAEVSGQDALSSGNALDNQQVTGGRGNQRAAGGSLLDLRARNLIVTGNAAGGRGFRGSVGYSAAGDFRESVGSDDLFDFRRDSAFSNPLTLSGTTYFGRNLGTTMGLVEYQRASSSSALSDFSLSGSRARSEVFMPGMDMQLRVDRATAQLADELDRRSSATMVGAVRAGDDRTFVIESLPLRGITARDARDLQLVTGLPTYDRLRVLEDLQSGITLPDELRTPFEMRFEDLATATGRVDDAPGDQRMSTLDRTGYEEMLSRIRGRFDDAAELSETYAAMRRQLRGEVEETEPGADAQQQRPRPIDTGVPNPLDRDPDRSDTELDEDDADALLRPMTEEQKQRLRDLTDALRHGGVIDTLSQRDEDRFSELMQQGEQQLKEGDFFWAERRFTRALQLKPGHPLASSGLGHAQLGAGLLLPAALTLESMMRDHPEMIDAAYAVGLFPPADRMQIVVNTINRRIEAQADVRPYALLLAYIGRHQQDQAKIIRGLELMREAAGEDAEEDVLLQVLEATWLADDEDASSENAGEGGASDD